MKLFTHTLFFFLLVSQICFAQWYEQNSGTTQNLNDVVFLNENTGIAVGDSGLILRTTNGGTLWSVVPTNVYDNLTSVSFVDGENGWVGGGTYSDSSVVLTTTDGGLNWYIQVKLDLYLLNEIFFVDHSKGFIVGWEGGGGNLFQTTDGGETWSDTTLPGWSGIQRVYFTDQDTGWILMRSCGVILCTSSIYKTTDGGNTWQMQMEELGPNLYDISFTDTQNGIAVGDLGLAGVVYRTTDGGETWVQNLGPPFGETTFVDVFHITSSVAVMWGTDPNNNFNNRDVFYSTANSGETWELRGQQEYRLAHTKLFFTDASNGWVVADSGIILHTTNGGVSFVEEEQTGEVPTEYLLSQNFPNPFNPSTKIRYSIPQSSQVRIKVFDVLGNEIETLMNEEKPVGTYEITWYAEGLPSGVYFYQLKAGDFMITKKMILMK